MQFECKLLNNAESEDCFLAQNHGAKLLLVDLNEFNE